MHMWSCISIFLPFHQLNNYSVTNVWAFSIVFVFMPLSPRKRTDVFRPTARVLLYLRERRGKELIITMTESMSRGVAVTFSSLCMATIKKKNCMKLGAGICVCS